ncbi:hypothetical protein ASPCAL04400 [Aspergillus calidoustus]|uniref:Uncharacterized protein n=1 Tax=Aspergillus calidoustus TaxID=454130 RepID=A0A0U5FUW4_ASPCI|nr:hypothetical protein ASPCAL04400 [Aspergillus calidoustus]
MSPSKRPLLADEELGKKDDDHRPTTSLEQQWQPKSWKRPRRRRIFLALFMLYMVYLFFKNMPTDLPSARERMKSRLPPSQHVLPGEAPPPGMASTHPPPRGESGLENKDEYYYEGQIQFYELGKSLKLFQPSARPTTSNSVIFAASSLGSVSDLLPLACRMVEVKLNKVHFLLMGRDDISIEDIQRVNGLAHTRCPIHWHDARVDYARWSTDARMEEAVAAVLPYIQTYLKPQVLVTQGDSWEDSYFLRGLQKARNLGVPHIKLTHAARDLMWLASLDSTALRSWNDVHVEFLIQAPRNSAGSIIKLIRSLERADFLGCSPSLTIELPSQVDSGLLHFLEKLKWLSDTPGKLTLRRRIGLHEMTPHEAALRAVEAFYPRNPLLSHVLVLSPDMELAPCFFHYLMYIILSYRHSTRSQTIHSDLFGVSLELPSLQLTNDEPFEQLNLDKTQFAKQNILGSLPLFLWQAPNSNAALYFGDKWAELHSFLSQRLAAKDTAGKPPKQEKVISRRYPAFLEFMHELLRARGYYLLYPAFPVNGRLSIAKFHDDLFQIPEEFAKDISESLSNGRQVFASSERSLSEASTLMPLLDTFSLEPPDISHLPLLSDRGKEISGSDFAHDTENYLRGFRVRYGGCPEDLLADNMSAEELFCKE